MSERHVQRLSVIIVAVVGALVVLFWPVMHKIVYPHEPMGSVLNLRPGIDMVGGTSLVYSIKQPPGGWHGGEPLAIAEMTALKRRVDPTGVKNLIWRPQGNDRLEIQLPMTPEVRAISDQRDQLEQQLAVAQSALDATNIRPQDVIDAVEQTNGKTRADLSKLELGSPQRKALFAQLITVWDAIQAAQKNQNADEQARQSLLWDSLTKSQPGQRSAIENTNLGVGDLESALSGGPTSPALANIKARFAGWPQRLAAIDQYAKVYDGLSKLKGTIDTSNDLKRELQGAGVLEFHILVDQTEITPADLQKLRDRLENLGPRVEAGDTMRWYEIEPSRAKSVRGISGTYNGKEYILAWITADKSLDNRPGTPAWRLTGARPETDPSNPTEAVVGFSFDPEGGALFGKLTGDNLHRAMAIMLDNKIISAPEIQKQITDSGIIDGGSEGFSHDELDYMIDTLTAGSLPAELSEQPISEQTVGPQLGQDNLHRGLLACVLGLVVVAVFLTCYYFVGGMVATFAVLLNVTLILAVMAGLSATFTLPSVAGIVLTIGTAVDAHVLIFERLREEQHRGLSLRMALRNAHNKALSAIVDSNMTTVITSIFLIWFGTEEVKGFGITLIIGIIASLFTALFVTSTILEILIEDFGLRNLNSLPLAFPKWDRLLRPNIDWMKLAPYFITFSIVGVGAGLGLFYHYAKAGEVLNIEFTSGTSVQFALKDALPIQDVRAMLDKANKDELPSFSLVSIGEGNTTYEVATPNPNAVQVRDAVIKSLVNSSGQSVLNAEVPSSFDGAGKPLTEVQNKQVIPISDASLADPAKWPGPFRPKGVGDFNPGVAIYLDHLDPPLSVTQIKQRITDEQQSEAGGVSAGAGASSQDFVVIGANGASTGGGPAGAAQTGSIDQPVTSAVILASQAGLDFTKDATSWQTQLAEPMWKLVNYGVNRPAQLQQVKNFDAAVAGDTKDNAILALTLSIIVIMIYIWVRFGNLKYGTATVVALLHDTLFTIAALGAAHYLVNFEALAKIFQLEPFRIDLTIVAGILTIMGYSMIDTIVVFDRIRENRGKFGHLNRQVINDAINQTLSRTLLTAGTTTITVAIMYFVGGPGIHGFTFVLLIGILVGTYSSIAIAAPLLLIGGKGGEKDSTARPGVGTRSTPPLQKAGA
jgi:SecD/SecF fusion protein